jgi:hypothetical protein
VIRTELVPVTQRLDQIELAQRATYTREMVDAKLKEVTDDIAWIKQTLGEAWQQIAVKLGVAVSLVALAHQYLHLF